MDVKSLKVFQHHCPEVSLCFARTNPTQPNKMAFNFSYFLPPFYLPENPFIFVNVINCVYALWVLSGLTLKLVVITFNSLASPFFYSY